MKKILFICSMLVFTCCKTNQKESVQTTQVKTDTVFRTDTIIKTDTIFKHDTVFKTSNEEIRLLRKTIEHQNEMIKKLKTNK